MNNPVEEKPLADVSGPTEEDIRDYAFHLYQQSGCVPGHDLDHWLEAKACLEANIPKEKARTRLHHHRHPEEADTIAIVTIESETTVITNAPVAEDETAVARVFLISPGPV